MLSKLKLIDVYYVRGSQGEIYSGDQNINEFISKWLTSETPMRIVFINYNPEDLLIGYNQAENPHDYFYQITGENPLNFINDTERIFYLTHVYGKPNKYISIEDYNLRIFYSNASSTALIALSDIFNICPSQQNPNVIRELLSDINLQSIDNFHKNAVEKITKCSNKEDFNKFLNSIGMLPIFDYDPFHDVFISNISQLNQYRLVQPDKIWNFDEVKDLPDIVIESIIQNLPDTQLLEIEARNFKFKDELDLSRPIFRTFLVKGAYEFLTRPRYYLNDNNIICGRLVDDIKEVNLDTFIQNIAHYGALIDTFNNPIDPETAEILNESISNPLLHDILKQIIIKTRAREIETKNIINKKKDSAGKLTLWSKRTKWFPVAINFDEYLQLWSPLFPDIIQDTTEYYEMVN
jgi:hypothetical protein